MSDTALMNTNELSVPDVTRQVQKIQDLMSTMMKNGEHYGIIPGTQGKPSLLKAGAEKLCFLFRLAPEFKVEEKDLAGGHREYSVTCILRNMASGNVVGSGVGCCTTMESKYRYRNAAKKCPHCGKEAIIKGKEEYGGGWVCFKKKDGCGAQFADDDPAIVNQASGKVDNPDIADTYNTVLKMAKKRAHVDATITACAASDIFTQDVEDFAPMDTRPAEPRPEEKKPDQGPNLHDRIAAARQKFVDILTDPIFTDEDRKKAKAKLEVGKETSEGYLSYVNSIVNEYEGKRKERQSPTIPDEAFETPKKEEPKAPVSGADLAKKFGVEMPKNEPKQEQLY